MWSSSAVSRIYTDRKPRPYLRHRPKTAVLSILMCACMEDHIHWPYYQVKFCGHLIITPISSWKHTFVQDVQLFHLLNWTVHWNRSDCKFRSMDFIDPWMETLIANSAKPSWLSSHTSLPSWTVFLLEFWVTLEYSWKSCCSLFLGAFSETWPSLGYLRLRLHCHFFLLSNGIVTVLVMSPRDAI